jgi:hypothetical protein
MDKCNECKDCKECKRVHKTECPVLRSAYCSICSTYGHFVDECTDYNAILTRSPQFIEQLLPYEVKHFYNIDTLTPIENTKIRTTDYEIIQDTSLSVRNALKERGLECITNNDENKRRLERWAIENGKKIQYKKNSKNEKDLQKEPKEPKEPKAKKKTVV